MDIVSKLTGIEEKFLNLCTTVLEQNNLALYDLIYNTKNKQLRIFIFKEDSGTVELKDCVLIDKALSSHIESEDWVPEDLILEVSSPGIFRDLKTIEHFKNAIEKDIKIELLSKLSNDSYPAVVKNKRKIVAILKGVTEEGINLICDTKDFFIEFSLIKKVNIEAKI